MSDDQPHRHTVALGEVARRMRGMWKWALHDDEIATLYTQTAHWPNVDHLLDALSHAERTMDDRPSVAYLLREARRRWSDAQAANERNSGDAPRLCPTCADGGGWVAVGATEAGLPLLRPCETCRPQQYELWEAGAYRLDSGGSDDPALSPIRAKFQAPT